MQVACNDIIQKKIEEEIKNRERSLRETYKDLQTTALENKLFQSILNDYEKYYNYIVNEKQQQHDAFKQISDHLDGLEFESTLTKDETDNLKNDQKEILSRLSFIRNELDDLVRVRG